ncbi:parvulin peptidyl-prolyl isomerase [Verrucomicrobia bacterium LW23]|nr:parvulin peptidyl-prolyl isomerase [Verrucomicrobia bacterium LW23]
MDMYMCNFTGWKATAATWSAVLAAFALFAADARAQQRPHVVDGVAAVVNKRVITFSEVRRLVGPAEQAVAQTMQPAEAMQKIKELRLGALNTLIEKQLIIESFNEMGASIPDNIIDERIRSTIVEKFDGDRMAFVRTLAAQGLSIESYRTEIKNTFIVAALEARNVRQSVLISPYRIEQYYSENFKQYMQEDQVDLRIIFISASAFKERRLNAKGVEEEFDPREEQIRAIYDRIVQGESFEDMARDYSEGVMRDRGGHMGWTKRGDISPTLANVAFKLRPGEMSKVIKIADTEMPGYYLLKVDEVKRASVRPLAEVRDEIEGALIQNERLRLRQEWLDSLKVKAYVKMF